MVKCGICGKHFKIVTNTHLNSKHKINLADYKRKFPGQKSGFLISPNLLPKTDLRFIKWKNSLKKRNTSWNKGFTKQNHPGVLKISRTMKKKKIDNFKKWRNKMKKIGKIKSRYPPLPKTKETAELIGLILGDGNLYKHDRVERLTIAFNKKYPEIIKRAKYLVEKLFQKVPKVEQSKTSNGARFWIYEKNISNRLGIPCGAKKCFNLKFPKWIWRSKHLVKACLIGLFNAEGSYSIHKPTYTYNLQFSNTNHSLLNDVFRALKMLKYNPEFRKNSVRLRKKPEAERFVKEINFRFYRS